MLLDVWLYNHLLIARVQTDQPCGHALLRLIGVLSVVPEVPERLGSLLLRGPLGTLEESLLVLIPLRPDHSLTPEGFLIVDQNRDPSKVHLGTIHGRHTPLFVTSLVEEGIEFLGCLERHHLFQGEHLQNLDRTRLRSCEVLDHASHLRTGVRLLKDLHSKHGMILLWIV